MRKFLGLVLLVWAMNSKADQTSNLYKKIKRAVVVINTYKNNLNDSLGTGFFIDDKGTVLTNYHVVSSGLGKEGRIEVVLENKIVIKDVQIGICQPPPIDLCFLKVGQQLDAIVDIYSPAPLDVGAKVYVFGHPHGLEFSITDGLLSGVHTMPSGDSTYERVQVSAPVSPGNSGGPIVNSAGLLIGVATRQLLLERTQNINFGASVNTVQKLYSQTKNKFVAKEQRADETRITLEKQIAQLVAKSLSPVYDLFESWIKITPRSSFFNADAKKYLSRHAGPRDLGGNELPLYIPKNYSDCKVIQNKESSVSFDYQCNDIARLSFIRVQMLKTKIPIEKAYWEEAFPPTPTPIVGEMKKNGTWSNYEKTLTPERRKLYYQFISRAPQCAAANSKSSFTLKQSKNCSVLVTNYRGITTANAKMGLYQYSPEHIIVVSVGNILPEHVLMSMHAYELVSMAMGLN